MNSMSISRNDIQELLAGDASEVFLSLESKFTSPLTDEMLKKIMFAYEGVNIEFSVELLLVVFSANIKKTYHMADYKTVERFDSTFKYMSGMDNPEKKALAKISSAKIGRDNLWVFLKPLIEEMGNRGFCIDKEKVSAFLESKEKTISIAKLSDSEIKKKKEEDRLKKIQQNYVDLISKDSLSKSEINTLNHLLNNVSSLIISDGIEQLENDNYMIAYIELIPAQFSSPVKLAYYCGIKDGFDNQLYDENAKYKKSHVFFALIEMLRSTFSINENIVSDFFDNKCQQFTVKKKPVISTIETKDFIDAEQLFSIHISNDVNNVVIKFEDDRCFVLMSNGTLYSVNSIASIPAYVENAYNWLINQGLMLPENVLRKYIGKSDFASPLYFKRK